jgi:hypothetical protein
MSVMTVVMTVEVSVMAVMMTVVMTVVMADQCKPLSDVTRLSFLFWTEKVKLGSPFWLKFGCSPTVYVLIQYRGFCCSLCLCF